LAVCFFELVKNMIKNCPKCHKNLKNEGIGWSEKGENTFETYVQNNELYFEHDEFYSSGEGEFYCRACGESLELSTDEIKKILK